MTEAQAIIFREFFEDTLGGGALEFEWLDPLTGGNVDLRLKPGTMPQLTNFAPGFYRVTMELETMP